MDAGTLTVAALATAAALASVVLCTNLCRPSGGVAARRGAKVSKRAVRHTVLLAGAPGSGKTALLHQLAFGRPVESVTGMREQALHKQLHSQEAAGEPVGPRAPKVTLVDYPGVGQLRSFLLRAAKDSGAVVVVVDAAGSTAHLADTADLLYDLFTTRSVVDGAPSVLLAANKCDKQGARSVEQLRAALEAELDTLKTSRAAVAQASDALSGGTGEADADAPLLLGTPGTRFTFATDAPLPVSWCSCAAAPGGVPVGAGAGGSKGGSEGAQLRDVEEFILAAVTGA